MIFLTLSHPIRKLILEIKIHQNQIKNNMTNVLPICYSPQIPTYLFTLCSRASIVLAVYIICT